MKFRIIASAFVIVVLIVLYAMFSSGGGSQTIDADPTFQQ